MESTLTLGSIVSPWDEAPVTAVQAERLLMQAVVTRVLRLKIYSCRFRRSFFDHKCGNHIASYGASGLMQISHHSLKSSVTGFFPLQEGG